MIRLNYEKIKQIQDKMLKKVQPHEETWNKEKFMYCPTCGKRMECKINDDKKF